MSEAFAMGGHGLYVWLAYGISIATLVVVALRPAIAMRRFRKLHQRDGEA